MVTRVKLTSRRLSYDLDFHGKYTVLTGVSGSGKTRLVKFLDSVRRGVPCEISGGYEVLGSSLSGRMFSDSVLSRKGAVIVIDEDVDRIEFESAVDDIKRSENYFIFITREAVRNSPYGVESVFELEGGPNHYRMVPASEYMLSVLCGPQGMRKLELK